MNNNSFRTPARETTIHPGAQIQSGVYIGPGCQISAEAVISLQAQLEGDVTIIGQVQIGRAVKIDTGCTLVGPLEIEYETTLGTGVVIGARVAPDAPRPLHTLIRQGAHIGSQAAIFAGLTLGEGSFVNTHSVLTGDLAAHCLAEGDPAALRGFICPCGGMIEHRLFSRSANEITYLCTVCRQPVTVPASLVPNINHVLLPCKKFGELVHFPDWKQPHWNEG